MADSGKPFDFEVAVVGGGSAGFAAARTSADAGLRTVVTEGGRDVGGLCILRGCMPSKALLHAAEVLHIARKAGAWGLDVGSAGFDIRKVMARKKRLIDEFADERMPHYHPTLAEIWTYPADELAGKISDRNNPFKRPDRP